MLIYTPNTRISRYFSMHHVAKNETAERNRLDNIPTTPILHAASLVATHILDPIYQLVREQMNNDNSLVILSWYRSAHIERIVCDSPFHTWCARLGISHTLDSWQKYFELKQHPLGQAVDFYIDGTANDVMFERIKQVLPVYDQLIYEYARAGDPNSGWIHASYREAGNRNEAFIMR